MPEPRLEREVDAELSSTFRETLEDGRVRLGRSWPGLIATGLVGGIDVSLGVLALFVLEEATGMPVIGALGFTIGFIALTLGKSELFTENFLVPVATVVARQARPRSLVRLWAGTAVTNLVGGWVFAWLLMGALPRLADTAIRTATFYVDLGISWEAFALGMVAGAAITIMTWMERSAETEFGRIVAASGIAFLLAGAPLNHVIVVSLEMFAAIHAGATFGYGTWALLMGWAALANMVGGLLLVTIIRLVQVGGHAFRAGSEIDEEELPGKQLAP